MNSDEIDQILRPKSIAVIGASTHPGKIGYSVVQNLIQDGYEGKIYPVNPNGEELLGLKIYPSIGAVPGPVDTAIMTVPAHLVPAAAEECGEKGVKGLVIITSGFSEVGRTDLEEQIIEIAKRYNMRILGPNIIGILSNSDKLNGSFAPFLPLQGRGSLVSQSGALLIGLDASTYTRRVGFDKMISIGNVADIDFADLITWLNEDENTSCIALYIEGFKDGRRVIEVARNAHKPIIGLKAGVSAHGAAAAASHTGSLAGSAQLYRAAFSQAGIIQADDLNNLFDRTLALSLQPPMRGDHLLIITNGGGVGVLATDAGEKYGIPLDFAPQDLQDELRKHMPEFGSAKNPVDLTGMAGREWYYDSIKFAYTHGWVDGLVVLYCETAMTDPEDIAQGIYQAISESPTNGKPVTVSFVGGEKSDRAMQWLIEHGIPAYNAPDLAVNAVAALHEYAAIENRNAEPVENAAVSTDHQAREIIRQARAQGRKALTEIEAKQIFELYGLPVAKTQLARTEDEAVALAERMGYPIVMKIVSPQIIHKSDAGGVKVNISSEQAVREAFRTIVNNAKNYDPQAQVHGVAVQEMAPSGTEVIIGSVNDPAFGPSVMFGLGGIFVEILKDVTFRVAPISVREALKMFGEIKGAPLLAGARGEAPRDQEAMAQILSRYSELAYDLRDEIAESDANPIILYEQGKGGKIVDARVILR
jgi:acetyltransferase